jgi:ferrous iron transport protein A
MQKQLSKMEFGESGTVTEIRANVAELNRMGMRKGKRLKMITKQPVKGPVVVIISEVEIAMGLDMAAQVMVELE